MSFSLVDTFTQAAPVGDWVIAGKHRADTGQLWNGPPPGTCNFQEYNPPSGQAPMVLAYLWGAASVGPHSFKVDSGIYHELNVTLRLYRGPNYGYNYQRSALIFRGNDKVLNGSGIDQLMLDYQKAADPTKVNIYLTQWQNGAVLGAALLIANVPWTNAWKRFRVYAKANLVRCYLADSDGGNEAQIGGDQVLNTPYDDAGHTYVGIACANSPGDMWDDLYVSGAPAIHLDPTEFAHSVPAGGMPPDPDLVAVTNDGGGTLSGLTADVVGAPSWVSAALDSDTAPTTLRITYDVSGIAPGTYDALVRVASAQAENTPQYVAVHLEATGVIGCNFATVLARAQEESGLVVEHVTTERAFADHIARMRAELQSACIAAGRDADANDQTCPVAATIALNPAMPQVQFVEARRIADAQWVKASIVDTTDDDAALPPRLHLHGSLVELVHFATEWNGIYDQIMLYGATVPVAAAVLTDDLAPNYFIAPLFCRCLGLAGAVYLAEKAELLTQAAASRREFAECKRLLLTQVRAQARQVQGRFRG